MRINEIDALVHREIKRAVKQVLESNISSDDSEKRRQERMSKAVKNRGVVADSDDSASSKEEAEDSEKEEKDAEDSKKSDPEKREDRTGGKGTADSPKVRDPKRSTIKSPTIGSVVDKLNVMRGGRSLKDPEVKESFAQYFEGLSTSERQTLLAFLTGIAQILAGTKEGTDAMEPSDIGVKTKKTKDSTEEPRPTSRSKEGTAENPIIVGENKRYDVIRALENYRRQKK